jgi:hypothetical protein
MLNVNELTADERRSLARLKQIGGERVLEVILKFASKDVDKLKKATEMVIIHRLQGRVEALEDLIQAASDAAKLEP